MSLWGVRRINNITILRQRGTAQVFSAVWRCCTSLRCYVKGGLVNLRNFDGAQMQKAASRC